MKKLSPLRIMIALLMLVSLFCSCNDKKPGGQAGNPGAPAPPNTDTILLQPRFPVKPVAGTVKIGVLYIGEGKCSFVGELEKLKKNGEKIEIISETVPNGDPSYASRLNDILSKKVHAMVIIPGDSVKAETMAKVALNNGVPTFVIGVPVGDIDVVTQVRKGFPNAGKTAGEFLVKNLDKKGTVLVFSTKISGDEDQMAVGFVETIKKYPEMKVQKVYLQGDNIDMNTALKEALKNPSEIAGIFAVNTSMAVATADYLNNNNLDYIPLIGAGGEVSAAKVMLRCKNYIADVSQKENAMAEISAPMVIKYIIKGEKVPRIVEGEYVVLTRDDVRKKAKLLEPVGDRKDLIPPQAPVEPPPAQGGKGNSPGMAPPAYSGPSSTGISENNSNEANPVQPVKDRKAGGRRNENL